MKDEDRRLVLELRNRLTEDVALRVKRFILFGSRVRDEADQDSDMDLIALVDEKTPLLEKQLEDAAYDVMWEHDFRPIISLKVFPEARFRDGVERGFSFYRNVEKEGIDL